MLPLHRNIRFWVLLASSIGSIVVYWFVRRMIPDGSLQTIRLGQIYGLTAAAFLYITVLAGPFCYAFPSFPWRTKYIRARRALGVSAFYFGCLHTYQTFFKQLGGFGGLGFLSTRYLVAIACSATALLIFAAMASTSFDRMIRLLHPRRWKALHRLVYLGGVLIIVHALIIGTHYRNLRSPIAITSFVLLAGLFILEARRVDAWFGRLFPGKLPPHLVLYLTDTALVAWLVFLLVSDEATLFSSRGGG